MNKNILKLAIPNIISNITVPLLSMVDLSIVGHLDSENYIGAIATSAIIFNFIYWSFSFLRMGTSGFTSQAYGASNTQETTNILIRSLAISLLGSAIIILLQNVIFNGYFHVIKASFEVKTYASEYFRIYIWAAPAILGMYAISGWFVGMQDAKTPMYIAIIINVINIILSLFFVLYLRFNIKGVAIASTLAQYSGLIIAILFILKKYRYIYKNIDLSILKEIAPFKAFFKVNTNIFIRTLLLISVTTFFTAASAKNGDLILAANALLMQFFTIFSYIMDGFAYAAEALTGKYIGAKRIDLLKVLLKRIFLWGSCLAFLFTILYYLFADLLLNILTNKQDVIDICIQYEFWVLLVPICGFAAFLWDGIFVGAMASSQMRNSMFVAAVSFFVLYYTLSPTMGNNALWLAFIIYLFARGIIQAFMFPSIRTSLEKDNNKKIKRE